MPLFQKSKSRTPSEVVSKLVASLATFSAAPKDKGLSKAQEDVARYLGYAKLLLFGDEQHAASKEAAQEFVVQASQTELLSLVVHYLKDMDFESRKDAGLVFGTIVRLRESKDEEEQTRADFRPGAAYIEQHSSLLDELFTGYKDSSVALITGGMLRDCIRDEGVARIVLFGPLLMQFFSKVEVVNFEVASDAFSTFKDLLTRHRELVASYLMDRYDEFFEAYTKLLQSENYATRRQSLKLLGELLMERANVRVMVRYVSDVNNLFVVMNLLRDNSKTIQFEAFHVFKVFVCNPHKPQPIVDILIKNRDKLVKYLEDFLQEKEDEEFREEKAFIIRDIAGLTVQPQAADNAADDNDATVDCGAAMSQ